MFTRSVSRSRGRTDVEREAAAYRRSDRWCLSRAAELALAMLGFVAAADILSDNSFLTHLATGRLIIDQGAVPSVDPYSRLAAGQAWTVQSWLPAVVYASLEQIFGLWSIRVFNGLIGAGIGLAVWRLTSPARLFMPRVVLAAFPLLIGYHLWSPRPLLIGLAALVAVVHTAQLGRSGLCLVPVMWVWVNSHGSWPLGLVLLASITVGAWLDDRNRKPDTIGLLGWAVVGVAAGAVSPVGPALWTFPFRVAARGEALAEVVEWQAPSFRSVGEWLFLGLIPIVLLAAARGARWRALVPAAGFLIIGLTAVRNLSAASVVIIAMVAPHLAELFGKDDGSVETRGSRIVGRALAASIVIVALSLAVRPAIDLAPYPVDEVDMLEARGLVADRSVGLVHREAVGNYLTYRFGADAAVFMDDRFDYHPVDLTADHVDLIDGGDFREILDRRGAQVVLWETERPLARWLNEAPEWRVVQRDDAWTVACRRSGPVAGRCTP